MSAAGLSSSAAERTRLRRRLRRAVAALLARRGRRRLLARRGRRRLAALLLAAGAVLAGYLGWLRDCSLVRVEDVSISGLTTADPPGLEAALTAAARRMTTLHVRRAALERAASGFRVVATVEASARFPHTLAIRVVEHRPVAVVPGPGGAPVAVSADGTLLPGVAAVRPLPILRVAPAAGGRPVDPKARPALALLAAAPPALLGRVTDASARPGAGLVLDLRDGPRLVFGDSSQAGAKWRAAATVLADPASRGAAYVDVRLPDRPAAGGLPGGGAAAPGTAGGGANGAGAPPGGAEAPGAPSGGAGAAGAAAAGPGRSGATGASGAGTAGSARGAPSTARGGGAFGRRSVVAPAPSPSSRPGGGGLRVGAGGNPRP